MIKDIMNNIYISVKEKEQRLKIRNPIKEWPTGVVSPQMGCDRGTPIDRFYIERFLKKYRYYITGNVMEIGDNSYTTKFGKNKINSMIFTADKEYKNDFAKVIIGDLQSGKGCIAESVDCFILTQTLSFIYDIDSAVQNIIQMLKPGGKALITVGGISMLSNYDYERWGHYWGFTEKSLRKLFESSKGNIEIETEVYGNPKVAAAFIYGLTVEDIGEDSFKKNDTLVQLIISAVVTKKE